MNSTAVAGAIHIPANVTPTSIVRTRIAFMDNLRYLMVVFMVAYHAVAAYAIVAPHWIVRDTNTPAADLIRELFDVFMMPVLFFAAGYFALSSLEKKGALEFLKDKVMRLLVPWALAMLVILPLALYDQPVKPIRPFWKYWLSYLSSFEVQLRFTQAPVGPTTQAIYWFISLLFAFFFVLALGYALTRGRMIRPAAPKAPSGRSILTALMVFGMLTSVASFLLLLFVPDSSWFTLHMFLEFQVTRLVPYAGYFALGVYAHSRGWFADGKPLGSLTVWGALSAVLAMAYLLFGQPVFVDTAGTAHLPMGYLAVFSLLRSFLLLSLLVVFLSFGARYWNSASLLDQQLAATSYNIYLVHYFIVVALQAALLGWGGGPVLIKIGIVFLGALAISFAFCRWILARHSRAVAMAILVLFVFCLVVRP